MFQLRWLWRNMDTRYRIQYVIALILSAATSMMLLVNPYLTSLLIDEVIIAQNTAPLLPLLAAMLIVHLARVGLRYVMILLLEASSQHTVLKLRNHLFGVLQYQENRFFDRYRTGDLMTRFSGDVDWCRHFLSFIGYQIVDCVFMFASVLIFLLWVNWLLALALVAVTPFLLIITKVYSKHVRPLFITMRETLSELNTATQENIAGNRVVKAFAREEFEKEKFDDRNRAFRDANLDINKKWLSFYPFIEILANAMTIITIFLGGLFIIQGWLTPGELAIFSGLTWALSNPMRSLGNLLGDFQRFLTSANKVIEVYYARPLIVDRPDSESHPQAAGHIEFRDVCFSFEQNTGSEKAGVLDHVSFTVNPGETLAILGPTGAGKTTLMNLLVRFYDVSGGAVLVDGCDVKRWKLEELRRAVGVATQEVFLFSDTVEGNVAFGNSDLSEERVQDFARRAAADEFIRKMPDGYDTIVGERGVGLSGGQKQRIALARAMAKEPAILVLDDTTSAVDMETETYLQAQFSQLPFACTRIIIAQRISSVKDADQILVLKDGRIAEQGRHEELLTRRGYYWETFALQNDIPIDTPTNITHIGSLRVG